MSFNRNVSAPALLTICLIVAVTCASCAQNAPIEPVLSPSLHEPDISASSVSEALPKIQSPEPQKPVEDAVTLRARKILAGMTQKEKIAQMFFVYFQDADSAELAREYGFGGYLLFSQNFEGMSKEAITKRIADCQEASKVKLLIGVDEEGGYVNRVSMHPQLRGSPFKSPQALMASGGMDAIEADAIEKSRLLKSLGINFNLAPVADVSTNPNDFIHYRTLGRDATATAQYVKTVVDAMNQEQIGCALKHFPGYGGNKDTHTGLAYDSRDYDTFLQSDFLPFIAGIKAGAGAVLVSHNIVSAMDSENPASLSPRVHEILRKDLGFDGVIMTDDLYMGAILEFAGSKGAAVSAILAGNDLLCCWDYETQIKAVEEAVSSGTIAASTIDESVMRILKWKLNLGIIEPA